MGTSKIAVTLEEATLKRLDQMVKLQIFSSRSEAVQIAVEEKLRRLDHARLAKESAKLVPTLEQQLADEVS